MPTHKQSKYAITLASALAAGYANAEPWVDPDDAIDKVAEALNPGFEQEQEAIRTQLASVLNPDVNRLISDFMGRLSEHRKEGGYLFGLAVGQLIRIPSLSPQKRGA